MFRGSLLKQSFYRIALSLGTTMLVAGCNPSGQSGVEKSLNGFFKIFSPNARNADPAPSTSTSTAKKTTPSPTPSTCTLTPPSVSFSSTPTSPSSSTSATYNWTGVTGSCGAGAPNSYTIVLYSNNTCTTAVAGQTFTGLSAATTTKTFTGLTQGSYYAKVIVYDSGLNSSSSACSSAYVLDTTVPTVSFSSTPTTPSNSTSATWAWTGAADTGGSGLSSFDVALHSNNTCTAAVAGQSFTGLSAATTSKNFTGLTQGSYYAKITAYDAAGNSASACSTVYLLDTTNPSVAYSSTPTTPSTSNSATWAWTGVSDAGGSGLASYDIVLHSNNTCTAAVAGQSYTGIAVGTTSQNFTGLTQGSYYAKLTAHDAAGNTASVCSSAYVLDTTNPTVAFSSLPTTPGNSTGPTWAWVGAADTGGSGLSTFDLVIHSNNTCTSAVAGQSYTALSAATTSKAVVGLTQGSYYAKITAYDAAGNSASACSTVYLLDTTNPTVAFSSLPTTPGNSTGPTWAWVGAADAGGSGLNTFDLVIHSNNTCTAAVAGQSYTALSAATTSKAVSGLTQGSYYAKITAYDAAGNSTSACSTVYVLDTTNPTLAFSSIPSSPGNSTTATYAWVGTSDSGGSGLATYDIVLHDNGTCTSAVAGQSYTGIASGTTSQNFTGLTQGSYYAKLTAYDAAGNSASVCSSVYLLDTTNPSIAFSSLPTTPNNSTTPTWAWTGAADTGGSGIASFDLVIHDNNTCTSAVAGQSYTGLAAATTSKQATGLTQGSYYAKATVYDAAGNSASVCSTIYLLDTTNPTIAFSSLPTTPSNSTSATWAWVGAADTGGSGLTTYDIALHDNNTCTSAVAGQSYTGIASGTTSQNFTGLTQGSYYAKVTAHDAAGNSASACSTVYLLDTTNPSIAFSSLPTTPGNSTTPTWAWVGAADTGGSGLSTYDLVIHDNNTCTSAVAGQSYTAIAAGTTSKQVNALAQGSYYAKITAYDAAGNSASACSTVYVLDTTVPTLAFSSQPTTPGNNTTPTWAWTAAADTGGSGLASFDLVIHDNNTCTSAVAGQSYTGLSAATTSKQVTALAQGSYYAKLTAYDAAGNSDSICSTVYLLDTTNPTVAFSSLPTTPSNATTPTWAWVGAADTGGSGLSTFDLVIHDNNTCTSAVAGQSYTGLTSATTSKQVNALTQGSYYAKITAYDAAGNSASACSTIFLLDTTAPTIAFSSTPTTPTASTSGTWAWTAAADTGGSNLASFDTGLYTDSGCTAAVGGQTFTGLSSATTSKNFVGLADGVYFAKTTAFDNAGNSASVCSGGFLVDTTAPTAAFSVVPVPPTTTLSGTWQWGAAADNVGGSGFQKADIELHTNNTCTAAVGGQSFVNIAASTRFKTFTGLTNAVTYYAKLTVYDNVNNVSASICSSGYTVTLTTPIAVYGGVGSNHFCVRLGSGQIKCWGSNSYGQLGIGENANIGDAAGELGDNLSVIPMGTGRTVSQLMRGSGGNYMCVILDNGKVKCWGQNALGQCGYGHQNDIGVLPNQMGDSLPYVDLGSGRTATQLAAGLQHVCALLDNAKVKCWGYNGYGQLGVGNTAYYGTSPGTMGDNLPYVDLGTGRTAVSVSAGAYHSCALLDNGTVKCWGAGGSGQLGQGNTNNLGDGVGEMGDSLPAINLGTGKTATMLFSGTYHNCAVLNDGTLKCWGYNINGQLGLEDTAARGDGAGEMGDSLPTVNYNGGTIAQGAADEYTTCIRTTTGIMRCWGYNGTGSRGIETTVAAGNSAGTMGASLTNVKLGTGRTATNIFSYTFGFCATLDNGGVKCWGSNTYGTSNSIALVSNWGTNPGQMGDSLPALDMGTGRTATDVAGGRSFACALLDNAQVKCWGYNGYGQLGIGLSTNRGDTANEMGTFLPTLNLGTGRTVKEMSVGAAHTCAILDNDKLKCWGNNGNGQLGYGNTAELGSLSSHMGDNLAYVDLGTGRTAKKVSAGTVQTCVILDNDQVKCWGYNDQGNLGLGHAVSIGDGAGEMGDSLPYVDLGTGRTAKVIASGYIHTCAILDNDKLKCWGYNGYGELGLGNTTAMGDHVNEMGDNLPYVDLGTGRTAVNVVLSNYATCALLDNGTVKCWGYGGYGPVGQGNTNTIGDGAGEMGDSLPAINLGTGLTATALFGAGANGHACAILNTGVVKCWGYNGNGQLGLETGAAKGQGATDMGDNLGTVNFGTGLSAVSMSTSGQSTCAVLDNNRIKCFGDSTSGALGTGAIWNYGLYIGSMGDNLPFVDL